VHDAPLDTQTQRYSLSGAARSIALNSCENAKLHDLIPIYLFCMLNTAQPKLCIV
jgi:hypothetical protein